MSSTHLSHDFSHDTGRAVRTVVEDPAGGTEQAFLFGPGEERMLGLLHRPAGDVRGALLILSPIEAELLQNYAREVHLARALTPRGIAVLRFHYRGAGNSDGESDRLTLDSMIEDGRAALEVLREAVGPAPVGFLGVRLGALAAAALTRACGAAPLAVWEPVTDGAGYFRELLRYRLMYELKRWTPDRPRPSTQALLGDLKARGHVELFGFALHRPLHESLQGRRLEDELGDSAGPMLLLQMGGGDSLRPEHEKLATRLRARGVPVDDARVVGSTAWWFDKDEDVDPALTEATAQWLERRLIKPEQEGPG